MKMTYLVKLHWKKILLSVYVVAVLVISATVRAESAIDPHALQQELDQIKADLNFLKERKLLDIQANDMRTGHVSASAQSLVGHFEVTPLQFENTNKVYFIALPSQARFAVEFNSSDIDFEHLDLHGLYEVEGFVVKQALPSRPQFLPNLIVTSIKMQR